MTILNSTVASTLSSINDINANIARLRDEAKAQRKSAIEPFLEALASSGEVSLIVVRGSTPSFNDGEPCEHSADLYVNVKSAVEEELHDNDLGFELADELVDGIKQERTWNRDKRDYDIDTTALAANVALCREYGHVYSEPSAEVMQAIRAVVFDTAEEEHDTNYYVSYVLKDGKFEVDSGEYDCGY